VLALDEVPPDPASAGGPEKDALSPNQQKALAILERVFIKRNDDAEAEQRRRLADESYVIRQAAANLIGVSLLSGDGDRRLLITHHLREFYAALPMPPGLDASTKAALRREALTMLLKLGPQDDIERMMISQMIASHWTSMACFGRAAAPETSPARVMQAQNQAQKLSRLFLDIERALRQRRKQLGVPARSKPPVDPKSMANDILRLLEIEGITFDDDDPST
jgi:hypothetical protein